MTQEKPRGFGKRHNVRLVGSSFAGYNALPRTEVIDSSCSSSQGKKEYFRLGNSNHSGKSY
jgi:hypothetical protein